MEKVHYTASCPICGRILFRGSPDSYLEGKCPKCGEYLLISFLENGVHTLVSKRVAEESRLSS